MIKIIFSDIDNTLIKDNGEFDLDTINKIKNLKKDGIIFVLCSGRQYLMIDKVGKEIKIEGIDDYYVALNGCLIYKNSEIIYGDSFEYEDVEKMIDIASKRKCCVDLFTNIGTVLINPNDKAISRYEKMLGKATIKTFKEIVKESLKVYRIMIVLDDVELIPTSEENIILNKFNVINKPYQYMEINNISSKGNAVEELCSLLKIDLSEALTIGDDNNDISMFEKITNSACPNNAIDIAKEKCTYISKYTNNDNAMLDILNHYFNN